MSEAADLSPGSSDTGPADQVPPEAGAFTVDVPGFRGTLEELVSRAQRGDVDLQAVPVSQITRGFRERCLGPEPRPDPREVADFLSLAARLLSLKAARLLPDGPIEEEAPGGDAAEEVDDPGARLAEYRLFKAAADALLADVAERGTQSFLGIIAPDVAPVERLSIAPERLAAAFRAVLERLPDVEPYELTVATFSVEDKLRVLRDLLRGRRAVDFDDVFLGVTSRLEAVACFLALLELLKSGEAGIEQAEPFAPIRITASTAGEVASG